MNALSASADYDQLPLSGNSGSEDQRMQGWPTIIDALKSRLRVDAQRTPEQKQVLVIDCCPDVKLDALDQQLAQAFPDALLVSTGQAQYPESMMLQLIERHISDDRMPGVCIPRKLSEFFDPLKLSLLKQGVQDTWEQQIIIYGPGASLVHPGDVHVCAGTLQRAMHSHKQKHQAASQDILCRYQLALGVLWHAFDRYKTPLLQRTDFLLDTHSSRTPTLISGNTLRAAMETEQRKQKPFETARFTSSFPGSTFPLNPVPCTSGAEACC